MNKYESIEMQYKLAVLLHMNSQDTTNFGLVNNLAYIDAEVIRGQFQIQVYPIASAPIMKSENGNVLL